MREKINEVKSGQNLIGKLVKIKSRDSDYDGEWGVIKYFDGDDYHIAPWNDSRMAMISMILLLAEVDTSSIKHLMEI